MYTLLNVERMIKGLPDYDAEDLHDLNKKRKNVVIVIDDLMEEAKDSKLVSKLFTQGRHRNVSVILILQNAFPKGKYNTEISRNAMYMVLFRSPADREQINRVGQRMFTNNNDLFMDIYRSVTEEPHGYILIDNKPETLAGHQVLSDVFDKALRYDIGGTLKANCGRDPKPVESMLNETNERGLRMSPPPPLPIDPVPPLSPVWPITPNVKKRKKDMPEIRKSKKRIMNDTNITPQPTANLSGQGFGGLRRCQRKIIMLQRDLEE